MYVQVMRNISREYYFYWLQREIIYFQKLKITETILQWKYYFLLLWFQCIEIFLEEKTNYNICNFTIKSKQNIFDITRKKMRMFYFHWILFECLLRMIYRLYDNIYYIDIYNLNIT